MCSVCYGFRMMKTVGRQLDTTKAAKNDFFPWGLSRFSQMMYSFFLGIVLSQMSYLSDVGICSSKGE